MSIRIPLLLLSLVLPGLALGEDVDPPGRVARLSFIRGEVSFQAADGQAPEQAVLNRPFTSGDRLMTGEDSRSELTLGVAAVRLAEHTDLSIANLDEEIAQFDINSGTVGVHVRQLENGETFEIDTPNSAIRLLEPGDYRVDVEPDGTVLSVREGKAEIDSGSGPTQVREGEQARLERDEQVADIRDIGRPDSFDDWGEERERQLNGQESTRYVSREVVGYEDLDYYGDWRTEVHYGAVWYPRVAIGWSPYRFGSWVWVAPWGWTWVDNSPWGFAPFHYGRWAHVRDRWCWVPGPRHYRPIYAPALVGWVGDPYSGLSVSIGSGPIGWFPLGPREVYVPYRRVSPRYLRNVNVSNTVIVNNTYITNVSRNRVRDVHYANRAIPGALITRPRHDFDSRRPPERREWTNRDVRGNGNRNVNERTYRNAGGFNMADTNTNVRNPRFSPGVNRNDGQDNRRIAPAPNRIPPPASLAETRSYSTPNFDRNRYRDNDNGRNRERTFDRNNSVARPVEVPQQRWRENRMERPQEIQRERRIEVPRQERRDFNGGDVAIQKRNHFYRMPDQTNRAGAGAGVERRAMPVRPAEARAPQVRPPPPPARAVAQGQGQSERSSPRPESKGRHHNR